MGIKYNGWSDLRSQIVFTLKNSVIFVEYEDYDPESPSKIIFGSENDSSHCMIFSVDSAVFKVHRIPITKICYALEPIE
jgi:hypothetical protein